MVDTRLHTIGDRQTATMPDAVPAAQVVRTVNGSDMDSVSEAPSMDSLTEPLFSLPFFDYSLDDFAQRARGGIPELAPNVVSLSHGDGVASWPYSEDRVAFQGPGVASGEILPLQHAALPEAGISAAVDEKDLISGLKLPAGVKIPCIYAPYAILNLTIVPQTPGDVQPLTDTSPSVGSSLDHTDRAASSVKDRAGRGSVGAMSATSVWSGSRA